MNKFISKMKPHDFQLVAVDTDAVTFCKKDNSPMTPEEIEDYLEELNSAMPEKIRFSNDGYKDTSIMVKTKNYLDITKGKRELKGASLKAPMKPQFLREFIQGVLNILVDPDHTHQQIIDLYRKTAEECLKVTEIKRFCKRVAYTEAVIKSQRTNELRVRLAIKNEVGVQQGDKFWMFYLPNGNLCLDKNFNGEYDRNKLLEQLYKTAEVFETILPMDLFINYSLQVNYYPFIGEEKPKRVQKPRKVTNKLTLVPNNGTIKESNEI